MKHAFHTIDLTREIAARPQTVYSMWSDTSHKEAWFMSGNGPEWTTVEYGGSLNEGGTERAVFRHNEIGRFTILSHVLVAQPSDRFIYAYRMDHNETPITASIVTIEISKKDKESHLRLVEQINFIDDGDSLETRLPGTQGVLDKMQAFAQQIEKDTQ